MQIECKINVDWIEEDDVDKVIQNKIIAATVETIKKEIAAKVDLLSVSILETRVNGMIDEVWENFMEKRVNITDKYGDTIESHESIKDMLKARLDDFINQRVDSEGKTYASNSKNCPYNAKPRLDYLLEKALKLHTEPFIKQVQNDFDLKLKATLDAKLKSAISASMLQNINIDKMLKQQGL